MIKPIEGFVVTVTVSRSKVVGGLRGSKTEITNSFKLPMAHIKIFSNLVRILSRWQVIRVVLFTDHHVRWGQKSLNGETDGTLHLLKQVCVCV